MEFKVCTYNCCSLSKNIDIVRQLSSNNIDIIFLQETFIIDEKLGLLDFIDENEKDLFIYNLDKKIFCFNIFSPLVKKYE